MKSVIKQTVLPPLFGIVSVTVLLILYNIIVHNGDGFTKPDHGFFQYIIPFSILFAVVIQFMVILPVWKRCRTAAKKEVRLSIVLLGILIFFAGLGFGLVFWERDFGIEELIYLSLTGIIALAVYWTVNIAILMWIDEQPRRRVIP